MADQKVAAKPAEKDDKTEPKPRGYKVTPRSDTQTVEARGAYDNLVGELLPGESGWLPLGDDGAPSGPAVKIRPAAPARSCRVMAIDPAQGGDLLVTNTGAPITAIMQAHTDVLPFVEPPPSPPPPPPPPVSRAGA